MNKYEKKPNRSLLLPAFQASKPNINDALFEKLGLETHNLIRNKDAVTVHQKVAD